MLKIKKTFALHTIELMDILFKIFKDNYQKNVNSY